MRIVSLCPSLTELVFDLDRGGDLIGVTRWCIHPSEGVARIEKVGGTKDPDVQRIISLRPDLVLLNNEENRIEDARALEAAGLKCHTSMPRSAAETAVMVRSIALELDRDATGERIATEIERRSEAVRRRSVGLPDVPFAYLVWRRPLITVNADTFAHSLLAQAGGRNIFGQREGRYPEIEVGDLAAGRPELVLLCTEPFPFTSRHAEELARDTDLPISRFRIADGEYLSWHGSRTPDGVDYAATLIESARQNHETAQPSA